MALTKKQVISIKESLATCTQREVAAKYGVSRSLISDIATGRTYKEYGGPVSTRRRRPKEGDERIAELEAEVLHLREERLRALNAVKSDRKQAGLFKAVVAELEDRIVPMQALPSSWKPSKKGTIKEDLVMHISDAHADSVVTPEECGGLETYNFPIACARAERYVDTVLQWTQRTLTNFQFENLWVLSYGDMTSGQIHGSENRTYFKNMMKSSLAIGQLQALMIGDLAPHFKQVHVVCLSGNHGRRTAKKDYHGANENWDFLIAQISRLHCRDIDNVDFCIPNAYSINLDINGIGFNLSHGDDVRSNSGIPFYGLTRRQKSLAALNAAFGGTPIRYVVMGHHHTNSSLADVNGEILVNGAWIATDQFSYNAFMGYRTPSQLVHGVNSKYGITWRLPVQLKHEGEKTGPKRYVIDGAENIAV